MAEIIENIHPTRMELLGMKKKIKTAEKGHRLLKEKRDALIMKFFEIIDKARSVRSKLIDTIGHSYENLIKAESIMGPSNVESIAESIPGISELKLKPENIIGVSIPRLESVEMGGIRESIGVEYSPMTTSSVLDEAANDFGEVLQQIIQLVEKEEQVRRLSGEIKKTKRRVNALEYIMIPRLKNTKKYIQMRLEEIERENFFRLKVVKRKRTIKC